MKKHLDNTRDEFTKYTEEYAYSIKNKDLYFSRYAREMLNWDVPFSKGFSGDISSPSWFDGGYINACYNCIDRYVLECPDKLAIVEEDNFGNVVEYTFSDCLNEIVRVSNFIVQYVKNNVYGGCECKKCGKDGIRSKDCDKCCGGECCGLDCNKNECDNIECNKKFDNKKNKKSINNKCCCDIKNKQDIRLESQNDDNENKSSAKLECKTMYKAINTNVEIKNDAKNTDNEVNNNKTYEFQDKMKNLCIALYMPMSAKAVFVVLACARLGITHNAVFAGFNSESLAMRILDSNACLLFTVDKCLREKKELNFLKNVSVCRDIVEEKRKDPLGVVVFDYKSNGKYKKIDSTNKDIVKNVEDSIKQKNTIDNDTKQKMMSDNIENNDDTVKKIKSDITDNIGNNDDNVKRKKGCNNDKKVKKDTNDVVFVSLKNKEKNMKQDKDFIYWSDVLKENKKTIDLDKFVPCKPVPSNHPLFYLYTSGSTGKPKGIVHSTGGYIFYAMLTTKKIFNLKPNDVFLSTADLGWITGHTYAVYGPLLNGCTTVIFGGVPTFPDPLRLFKSVEKNKITHLYTAPTAIRTLQKMLGNETDKVVDKRNLNTDTVFKDNKGFSNHGFDLSSLRILGSVGEPINKEAYSWFRNQFGPDLPLVDTYWQTEAGGIMISPMPGFEKIVPECACLPFFGMEPLVVKLKTSEQEKNDCEKNTKSIENLNDNIDKINENDIKSKNSEEKKNNEENDIENSEGFENKDFKYVNNKDNKGVYSNYNPSINPVQDDMNSKANKKNQVNNNESMVSVDPRTLSFFEKECLERPLSKLDKPETTINTFEECKEGELGTLIFKGSWPGISQTILNDNKRFKDTYFGAFKGYYSTGDEAIRKGNLFYIRGRADDVLNVSGHRLSTGEIESATCSDKHIVECAVVAGRDEVTGQALILFVVLKNEFTEKKNIDPSKKENNEKINISGTTSTIFVNSSDTTTQSSSENNENHKNIKASIRSTLRNRIGPIVYPKKIYIIEELPKTRTGKIMRRVLRGLIENKELGDLSTCNNIDAIDKIKKVIENHN